MSNNEQDADLIYAADDNDGIDLRDDCHELEEIPLTEPTEVRLILLSLLILLLG